MENKSIYKEKFHYVSFKSKDGFKKKELFIGKTPELSLANARAFNRGCKSFRVALTAYNTLGEKV